MFQQAGMEDFRKTSLKAVAIKYPKTNKPMILRSDYQQGPMSLQDPLVPSMWELMVKRILDDPKANGVVITEDSEEGQAILNGTPLVSVTKEFLLGLVGKDGDLARLREYASLYDVKFNEKTSANAIAFKVLAAVADGVKPKAPKEAPSAV
jgi:hypothetical protein